jgi:hypothetical protein
MEQLDADGFSRSRNQEISRLHRSVKISPQACVLGLHFDRPPPLAPSDQTGVEGVEVART